MNRIKLRFFDGEKIRQAEFSHQVDFAPNKQVVCTRSYSGFMQHIGLTDCDGVEIYEGDIIKKPNGDWGVIVWKSPSFEVTVGSEQSSLYSLAYFEDVKVIGNIHENPELLEK